MDYKIKNMIVNALIGVVDNAPTKTTMQFATYPPSSMVNKERFDAWIRYINSVMQVTSSYVDVSGCVSNINTVVMQPNPNNEYASKVNNICQIVLDFARAILYL